MRHDVSSLNVPSVVAAGTSQRIEQLVDTAVFIGTSDAVAPVGVGLVVEGTASRGEFVMNQWITIATVTNTQVGSGLVVEIPAYYTKVRIRTTSYTSGNVVAGVSGKNTRTDH